MCQSTITHSSKVRQTNRTKLRQPSKNSKLLLHQPSPISQLHSQSMRRKLRSTRNSFLQKALRKGNRWLTADAACQISCKAKDEQECQAQGATKKVFHRTSSSQIDLTPKCKLLILDKRCSHPEKKVEKVSQHMRNIMVLNKKRARIINLCRVSKPSQLKRNLKTARRVVYQH